MNEKEFVDLKAELEMPSYEELQDLQKRLETLEFKFNELIDILDKHLVLPTLGYSKVKTQ